MTTRIAYRKGVPTVESLQSFLVGSPTRRALESDDEFARVVMDLHGRNLFQWRCESQIRDPEPAPVEIARLKRAIDRSNKQRARLVQRLDELSADRLGLEGGYDSGGYVNSESIGQLIDRLSILGLKLFFVRARARDERMSEHLRLKCEEHARELELQRQYVETCYERFLDQLARGSGSMLVSTQLKFYEDADL